MGGSIGSGGIGGSGRQSSIFSHMNIILTMGFKDYYLI